MGGCEIYETLDRAINDVRATARGFTQLVATGPHRLSAGDLRRERRRYGTYVRYFRSAIDVFEAALRRELPDDIAVLLLNETPAQFRTEYHLRILDRKKTYPLFFRSDDGQPGRAVELQCPGSLWGDYEAVRALLGGESVPSLADSFVSSAKELLGANVNVHHLLDNASSPHTMRYFIERTRPGVRYFGIDSDVDQLSCKLIRSHSFFGQAAECFFKPRLESYMDGQLVFDLPPLVIFDQKVTMTLPFRAETRGFFDDEVRDALVYTAVVLEDGIELPDGAKVSLESFASASRSDRRWFLKYAGCDVSINWGSREVYNLSKEGRESCLARLRSAAEDGARGRVWVVQPQEQERGEVEWLSRRGSVETGELTLKRSSFFGPSGYLGTMLQHRHFYKVHGQTDTIVSIGVEPEE